MYPFPPPRALVVIGLIAWLDSTVRVAARHVAESATVLLWVGVLWFAWTVTP